MKFIEGIKINAYNFTENINGATYLSWAAALALAGRPQQEVVLFGGRPFLPLFGGALVAVDSPSGENRQRTWLPILGGNNAPIPLSAISPRDVNDAIMRCRAKAVAMVNGVGLSIYAGFDGDALGFIKALGVKPDSDLTQANPLTEEKGGGGAKYVPWAAALAAARITDQNFFWEVLEFDAINPETGEVSRLPACRVAGGWMVSVRVFYKGREHVEWLPVMGVAEVRTRNGVRKLDHQPLAEPTVFEWNRSVMRCLAKAIAVATGYGLGVYAGEDLAAIKAAQEASQRKPVKPAADGAAPAETAQAPAEAAQQADGSDAAPEAETGTDAVTSENGSTELLAALRKEMGAMPPQTRERVLRGVLMRGWVSTQPASIEALVTNHPDAARKLLDALRAKRAN